VGGTDGSHELATAEVYDPATGATTKTEPLAAARQSQFAARPAGVDRVLIAAGTANGKSVDSAEFFVPARNAFEPAPEIEAGQKVGRILTIGLLGADASLRAARSYLLPPREN